MAEDENKGATRGDLARRVNDAFQLLDDLRHMVPAHHRRQLDRLNQVADQLVLFAMDYRLPVKPVETQPVQPNPEG